MTAAPIATVFVSLGTNVDRAENIQAALALLENHCGALQCSRIYETQAVADKGNHYYNLVVCFETDESVDQLRQTLRSVENQLGRDREKPHLIPIDLDLLLYQFHGARQCELSLLHPDIEKYEHVLRPLAELTEKQIYLASGLSFVELLKRGEYQKTIIREVFLPSSDTVMVKQDYGKKNTAKIKPR